MMVWTMLGTAHAATWTYRAPVPSIAPPDDLGFEVCVVLPFDLQVEEQTYTEGNVSWNCHSERDATRLCYEVVSTPWPETWGDLRCEGPKTALVLDLIPAFDPTDDPVDGLTLSRRIDEVASVFVLDPINWPDQRFSDDRRGTSCVIRTGRLWISREGRSRRKGLCEIRDRAGTVYPVEVVFGAL